MTQIFWKKKELKEYIVLRRTKLGAIFSLILILSLISLLVAINMVGAKPTFIPPFLLLFLIGIFYTAISWYEFGFDNLSKVYFVTGSRHLHLEQAIKGHTWLRIKAIVGYFMEYWIKKF